MQDTKERVALTSIAASGGLTIAKAVVGLFSGSLALLSEAAHSALDFVATVMTWYAVRISGKPADEEHHYGHGKVESVSALIETGLLFVLSGVVIWEAVTRLLGSDGHAVEATIWAFAVIIVSIVVDFLRARLLYRVAEQTTSAALEADALHFGSDMWSSIAVLIGLGGVALGYSWADSAAALVVAVFILVAGWRLGRRTVETLTDTAPEGAAARISAIASRVPRRGRDRPRPRPFGRPDAVRRSGGGRQPHAAARPRDRDQDGADAGDPRGTAGGRSRRRDRAPCAERRVCAGARDGDRAQSRACGASRHRACDRRTAVDLARSGGRWKSVACRCA
jgi:cation diffusion facilitator family transporter